jgi:hypothetical protein
MDQLPPELEPRRDALFERVTARGRTLRRRRIAAMSTAMALAVLIPAATVALVQADDDPPRVEASGSIPGGDTTTTSTTAAPTTSTVACRNSTNPACGPLHYDPPMTNAPATISVTTTPAVPRAGDVVTFTLHVTDADSRITSANPCMQYTFGEGVDGKCIADCSAHAPQYGAWDPPPPEPGDATFTMRHAYATAGVYNAKFEVTPGLCGPRPSPVTATVRMEIAA